MVFFLVHLLDFQESRGECLLDISIFKPRALIVGSIFNSKEQERKKVYFFSGRLHLEKTENVLSYTSLWINMVVVYPLQHGCEDQV